MKKLGIESSLYINSRYRKWMVDTVHCFGGEVGMEGYCAARPDVFFTGKDGSLRRNKAFAQVAGQYAVDINQFMKK